METVLEWKFQKGTISRSQVYLLCSQTPSPSVIAHVLGYPPSVDQQRSHVLRCIFLVPKHHPWFAHVIGCPPSVDHNDLTFQGVSVFSQTPSVVSHVLGCPPSVDQQRSHVLGCFFFIPNHHPWLPTLQGVYDLFIILRIYSNVPYTDHHDLVFQGSIIVHKLQISCFSRSFWLHLCSLNTNIF